MIDQRPHETSRQRTLAALRRARLRPTRQRMALAGLIYARGNRHLTAEGLHEEAMAGQVEVSLATIYNTLKQFSRVGLLRQIAVDGQRTYFDTNTTAHHHFFVEEENRVIDVPDGALTVEGEVSAPEGYRTSRIDVVVRLRAVNSA